MAQVFTDVMVRKLLPKDRDRFEVWDGRVPGFGLRVGVSLLNLFMHQHSHAVFWIDKISYRLAPARCASNVLTLNFFSKRNQGHCMQVF